MSTDRIQKLREKRARLDAKLKAAEARQREQERNDDTHIKAAIGALSLKHMTSNPDSEFAKTLWPLLDEYVTYPRTRQLISNAIRPFGLKDLVPLPEQAPAVANDQAVAPEANVAFSKSKS